MGVVKGLDLSSSPDLGMKPVGGFGPILLSLPYAEGNVKKAAKETVENYPVTRNPD